MTALSADKVRDVLGEGGKRGYVGATGGTKWFIGSLIMIAADGYGAAATDAASLHVVGVATNSGDNTSGADGDLTIEYEWGHVEGFALNGLAITDVGANACVLDDATLGGATEATNDRPAGRIVAVRNSKAYIEVCRFGPTNAT